MKGRGAADRHSQPPAEGHEQLPSAFNTILGRLVSSSPGAKGAVLADEEGETVDFFSRDLDPEELKLAAAYMGILLNRVSSTATVERGGGLQELWLKCTQTSFVSRPLGSGYQITVVLNPVATLPKLFQAMDQAMAELRVEAGGVLD